MLDDPDTRTIPIAPPLAVDTAHIVSVFSIYVESIQIMEKIIKNNYLSDVYSINSDNSCKNKLYPCSCLYNSLFSA